MAYNPNQESTSYEGGYHPQQSPETSYTPDEMPQSSYPHEGSTSSGGKENNAYSQQQQSYEQGQQQQYYQPPYSTFTADNDADANEMTSMGMKARTAGWLAYIGGWISGIIFLVLEKENRFVRFHAAQSIILFGALSILQWIAQMIHFGALSGGLGVVWLICWLFLMINTAKGKYYKLPIIGDYAEKLANRPQSFPR
jgi:uncharacterized membrane protein